MLARIDDGVPRLARAANGINNLALQVLPDHVGRVMPGSTRHRARRVHVRLAIRRESFDVKQ